MGKIEKYKKLGTNIHINIIKKDIFRNLKIEKQNSPKKEFEPFSLKRQ